MRQTAAEDAQYKNVEALVALAMLYMRRGNNQADNDGSAGFAFAANARLNFGVELNAVGNAIFRDAPIRRNRFARVHRRMPRAGG